MHDVRQNPCIQQLQLEDHDHTYEPEDMEPPMLEVQCRALPVASIGKGHLSLSICCYSYRSGACCCRLQGLQQVSTVESSYCKIESSCGPGAAAFANKLDAVIFTILLEVGWSERPLDNFDAYSKRVVSACSDQGHARKYVPLRCLHWGDSHERSLSGSFVQYLTE